MENIKLTIDNREVEVPKGTTILDAAKSMGIRIPTLCHMKLEDLHYENNPGACRICVVEIEGRRNLAPSCKMECTEGMVVRTHTPPGNECPEDSDGTDSVQPSGRLPYL